MARDLTGQLRVACATVVSSAQGLPSTVQEQLLSARRTAEELQRSLVNASTLTPHLLQQTRKQITQVSRQVSTHGLPAFHPYIYSIYYIQ